MKTSTDLENIYIESRNRFVKKPIIQNTYLRGWELLAATDYDVIESPILENDLYARVPKMTQNESLAILESSKWAWDEKRGERPRKSIAQRCEVIQAFMQDMKKIRSEVVEDLMFEIAKNRTAAENEFDRTVEYIDATLKEAKKLSVDYSDGSWAKISTEKDPLGVTLCMSPYNYPLNETFTTFIPALVMGNVAILKPARYGVAFWKHFLPLFQKHFPKGVVNTVYWDGKEVITPLMQSGEIDVLAFIWSNRVAKIIASQHPNIHALTQVLGMWAKNPMIITDTADIDAAVTSAIQWALSYNWQRCTAHKTLRVHKTIYDTFVAQFVDQVQKLTIWMPHTYYTSANCTWFHIDEKIAPAITPLPEPWKIQEMHKYIQDAVSKGATILNKDWWDFYHRLMVPAVLWWVEQGMLIDAEEQFGPVVPITKYSEIDESIKWMIDSPFGQQASIYTNNAVEYEHFKRQVRWQISRLNHNRKCQRWPDHVAFAWTKWSAVGTLSISEALLRFSDDFVEAKN